MSSRHRWSGGRGRRRRATAVLVAGALVVTGGVVTASVLGHQPPAIATMPAPVALLVGEGSAAAESAFRTIVAKAQDEGRRLVVGPIGSAGPAFDGALAPVGMNDLERQTNLDRTMEQARQQVDDLLHSTEQGFAVDGLHGLAQRVRPVGPDGLEVVVVGEVTQVSPDIDLDDPVVRGDPEAVLRAIGGSVESCAGWRVSILDGSGNAGLTDARRDLEVREVWRQIVEACGGTLVAWDTGSLAEFPATVPVPTAPPTVPCTLNFRVAGDTLFSGDQWTVRPDATQTLSSLAVALQQTRPNATATIDGYTADSLDTRYDLVDLSKRRADAVEAWLTDHGVEARRLTAVGHGPSDPVAPNDSEESQRQNRRVEITLHLAPRDCAE